MKMKIVNKSNNDYPQYETTGSAGMDIRAYVPDTVTLMPLERTLIPTGLYIELPEGVEAQIRPRSGLSIKHGLTLVNCVGTIDSDYRGEIKVPIVNLSNEPQYIRAGERIAQMVVARYERAELEPVGCIESLSTTNRGDGGFGSTGK